MDFYEWNIADDDAKSRVAKNWTRLESILNVNKTHVCNLLSKSSDLIIC